MTVSARVDYACRALLELAHRYENRQPVPLREMTGDQSMPAQFLSQILQQLKSSGLIVSTRGAHGGYRLSRSPGEINLWDVVVAIEGVPSNESGDENSAFSRCLQQTWSELAEQREQQLCDLTLEVLLERARNDAGAMYYI